MGSRFGRVNTSGPIWLAPMLARVPMCMTADRWATYLDGVRGQACSDNTLRKRLERGVAPSHCVGCTPAYQSEMDDRGLCQPAPVEVEA